MKRKLDISDLEKKDTKKNNVSTPSDSDNEDSADDVIQVDFDFFSFRDGDYHTTKHLLQQLFSGDSENIPLRDISEKIISQNSLGTAVKCDGEDGQPLAFLSAIGLTGCDKILHPIKNFLERKFKSDQNLLKKFYTLTKEKKLWLLLNERLINMPPQISPPLFRMLKEEMISGDIKCDGFLYFSKLYKEVPSGIDEENDLIRGSDIPVSTKKPKIDEQYDFYHPEDEVIFEHSAWCKSYTPAKKQNSRVSDAVRVFNEFGIEEKRCVMFVPFDELEDICQEMAELIPAPLSK